ncbi:MAG: tetratricopeptide repeat-containing sensor histidine kinase [Armatimonadetes bacterium]|nr:tetratricopeptide repeat-containing sensor histidine kinase [Armatimonadota bacterium]
MRKLSFVILFLLFSSILFSANSQIDSLFYRYQFTDGLERIDLINQIAEELSVHSPNQSLSWAGYALILSEEMNYDKGKAYALENIGSCHYSLKLYKRALDYYQQSLQIEQSLNNKEGEARTLNDIGLAYQQLNDYDKALEIFLKSLIINEQIGNKKGSSQSLTNIGNLYCFRNENEKALAYHLDALTIYEEIDDKVNISKGLNNIASIYVYWLEYEQALEYYQRSLENYKEIGDENGIATTMHYIGLTYQNLQNFEQALIYFLKAKKIYEKIGNKSGDAESSINIASIYLKSNDFVQAANHLEKSLELAKEVEKKDLIQENYLLFSNLFSSQSDFKKSLEYYKLYSDFKDSIITVETDEEINKLRTGYNKEQSKIMNESNLIKQERLFSKVLELRLFLIILFGTLFVMLLYYVYWTKKKDNRDLQIQIIERKKAEEEVTKSHEELKELHKGLQKKVKVAVKDIRKKDHIIIKQFRQAATGDMIANIAHHWRQPITAVGAIVQSYEDALEDGMLDQDYLEEKTDEVMDILTKMSRTIDDFRTFFKPNKVAERFYLKENLEKVLRFVSTSLEVQKIKLETDFTHDSRIVGFAGDFSQTIMNILDNSKCAFEERKIKNPKITISLTKEDDKNVIIIKDNGGGIPEDIIDKIFDPYFSTWEVGKDIGIGLYMAKMIIEKNMGGKLTACNIGEGAEFRIEI